MKSDIPALIAAQKAQRLSRKQRKLITFPIANLVAMNIRDATKAIYGPFHVPPKPPSRLHELLGCVATALLVIIVGLAIKG